MNEPLQFILNDRQLSVEVPPGLLVLDLLREHLRQVGTKEGCREGDCGACVVLVGELSGDGVRYRAVTSCLMPAGELAGKHLITIEGLRAPVLSSLQEAIVEEGASQCGFCTPGIVLSLTGALLERSEPMDAAAVKTALGGHLCRCTGYRSLKAVRHALEDSPVGVPALVGSGELPGWMLTIPQRLRALGPDTTTNGAASPGRAIAGGTDLYVQQGDALAEDASVQVLGNRADLRGIVDKEDSLWIGPSTTFEQLAESDAIRRLVPEIRAYMDDIASVQIRNRATVGGNLVNASPIGDVTILLLAFDTHLALTAPDGAERTVPLRRFYRGYKDIDLGPGELVTGITVRKPPSGAVVSWEKVSKRRSLDIASVNSALLIHSSGDTIESATLTFGGVAPVPFLAAQTSSWMAGKPLNAETVREAGEYVQREIAPISDIRGSASYKRLLARQLLWAHITTLFPDQVQLEALYEEH
ncbi:MAG: FAD binding domain-containing protein [Rhodothermales bacterium]|nr:FAD binding domain-containing protein [Rhodothermales bacterium]MBO6778637.1 FAD binding domain-containing protein [Rhodothermales bacterium]